MRFLILAGYGESRGGWYDYRGEQDDFDCALALASKIIDDGDAEWAQIVEVGDGVSGSFVVAYYDSSERRWIEDELP